MSVVSLRGSWLTGCDRRLDTIIIVLALLLHVQYRLRLSLIYVIPVDIILHSHILTGGESHEIGRRYLFSFLNYISACHVHIHAPLRVPPTTQSCQHLAALHVNCGLLSAESFCVRFGERWSSAPWPKCLLERTLAASMHPRSYGCAPVWIAVAQIMLYSYPPRRSVVRSSYFYYSSAEIVLGNEKLGLRLLNRSTSVGTFFVVWTDNNGQLGLDDFSYTGVELDFIL